MSSAVKIILLERVDNLGDLGDEVSVKPGFARNFLFPQGKALRATKDNVANFEAQKKEIEKKNEANRKDAEKRAKTLEGLMVNIIRHASESGQLYGSVSSRDITDAIAENTKEKLPRSAIEINQAIKTIGLFEVPVALHAEVKVDITINVARSEDEAKLQAKTGKALITEDESGAEIPAPTEAPTVDEDASEAAKKELMDEDAYKAEQEREAEEKAEAAEEAAVAQAKAEEKAAKEAEEAEAGKAEEETAKSASDEQKEEETKE